MPPGSTSARCGVTNIAWMRLFVRAPHIFFPRFLVANLAFHRTLPAAKFFIIFYDEKFPFIARRRQNWHRPQYWKSCSKRPRHQEITTDWKSWKRASGWIRSITCFRGAALSAPDGYFSSFNFMLAGPPESTFLLPPPPPTKIRFLSGSKRRFLEARRWSGGSRAWCAGTRWPWWFGPTKRRTASADTFRPMPRPRTFTKSHSTTFFGHVRRQATATSFITRVTPRRECMHARSWKVGCPRRSWKTFAAN